MEKVDDKLNDVKNETREHKQQTTSETGNLESASSSYNAFSESKVDMNKFNDGQNMSGDGCQLRNIEEKSSLSSDEYENNKVSVGNHKELETSLQSQHTDGSDESDVVEHDVKVCDTCGDAGREDLLATCFRCIDGAEHTYCMKEPVDQVPKGDWLCEECKLEDVKNTNRVYGKRRAEEFISSSSFKKQALDVDRGKVKPIHQVLSDSHFGTEGSRSPATHQHLQSLRGAFSKSNSFSVSNPQSKTKLVDEVVLQRKKSTKERSSHDTFRSINSGPSGPSGSKVKMLSPHLQDFKSPKERTFEKTNSVKLNSSGSNAQVKGDSKVISGLKLTNRSVNISTEAPVSLGQFNEQLPSSPTRVSSSVNAVDQKSVDISSKVAESTNLADGTTMGNNVSGLKTSKDVKNRDIKLKDAIEAALLKKPGIYRKNKVPDQPAAANESTLNNNNNNFSEPHTGTLTSADVSSTDWHSKHSNGNSFKQSLILPSEAKPLTARRDDVALSSLLKSTSVPDHECIWQGSFEINRSGKTAEFWDGLQAHLSSCASPRVYEAVNKLPHKILLNGVSRASAWPTQFENKGVKENNIGIYFFAKDVESYEKSYQVLLEDMMRGDLALIGSINGVELLIFPSNRLPEKSNRWNMFFFLWGVFRGKKKNSLHQIPNNREKNCFVSSNPTDKISVAENVGPFGAVEKDEHVDVESKVNSNLPNSSHEKRIDSSISRPVDNVNVVPVNSKEIITENEPIKRPFIDLSEDDNDFNGTSQTESTGTLHDASGQQEGNLSKKQKSDFFGERLNKKPVFTLDLNEDISCVVGETDNIVMTKKDGDDDVAPTLSLSLAFSTSDKDDEVDRRRKGEMVFFRDVIDKQ